MMSREPQQDMGGSVRDPREHSRFFSRIGFSLLVLTVVMVVMQYAIQLIALYLYPDLLSQWWFVWLLSFVPLYGFGLPAMIISLRGIPTAPMCDTYVQNEQILPKPRLKAGWVAVLVIVAFGYMYIGSYIGNGLMSAYSALMGYSYQNPLNDIINQSPVWMTVLGTVIFAPIGEEFIFRKLLIDRTRRYGDTVSILISAFFFALFHGNLFQFFYAFLLGLILGYLYTRTGKLRFSVGLHMLVNLVGGVLAPALANAVDPEALYSKDMEVMMNYIAKHPLPVLGLVLFSMLVYSLIIASVVLTTTLRRKIKLGQGQVVLHRDERIVTVLGNAGMITAFVACCLLMAFSLLPR